MAGSIITGLALLILIPSALSLDERGVDGRMAEFGATFGSIALGAGVASAVVGWAVYADTYRSVDGPGSLPAGDQGY